MSKIEPTPAEEARKAAAYLRDELLRAEASPEGGNVVTLSFEVVRPLADLIDELGDLMGDARAAEKAGMVADSHGDTWKDWTFALQIARAINGSDA